MRQKFTCMRCGYIGVPIHGIEEEEDEEGTRFVGCDSCGTRHLVVMFEKRRFEILRIHPDDLDLWLSR
ncbi:hypothetical protein DFR24_2235 [Panacagrimonas perspica]|uniref:DNL-type domain-containing protein n=1 Tax=Panacagrimonas perspica TaxID=381431 RepID=A0A4R7PF58_9GAMM|nr:hypothetical protein DFR24_2235 [Panacagrimonas perspica]THD00942.1 hypothetical protein B1810_22035 [Panacagrimonas perspica]